MRSSVKIGSVTSFIVQLNLFPSILLFIVFLMSMNYPYLFLLKHALTNNLNLQMCFIAIWGKHSFMVDGWWLSKQISMYFESVINKVELTQYLFKSRDIAHTIQFNLSVIGVFDQFNRFCVALLLLIKLICTWKLLFIHATISIDYPSSEIKLYSDIK